MKRLLPILVLVLLAMLTLGTAYGQETTTGSITGEVVDSTGAALPGVTVTLVSSQGTKAFVTDATGRFFAPYLTPGRYTMRLELAGFSPIERKDVDVRLGQRLDLPFTMKVGGVEEVIQVTGAAPTVDTSSTTAGTVLDSDTLNRLPVQRRFSETLYLVAGVSESGVGRANPAVGGASGLENNYVIDGVNITNTGYGALGSYSIYHGSLGNGVTTDFIAETQVKTAGFEAEYGQATGGVMNVITRSGSNDFRGSVYGFFRPEAFESDFRQLQTVNGTVNDRGTESYDVGLAIGGPLVKERLFFFGAVNPQFDDRKLIAPEGFPLESLGEVTRKRRIVSYAGKLTWQPGPNHHFNLSVFGDPAKGEMGAQRLTALVREDNTGFSELKYGGHNQTLRYDGVVRPNWMIEAYVARAYNYLEETPQVDQWSVTDRTVTPNTRAGGIGFFEVGNDGKNWQYSLKSTHIFQAAGSHQVRYGGLFEDITYDNTTQRTGPTFTLSNGQQTVTGAQIQILTDPVYGRIWRVTRANISNVRNTTQQYSTSSSRTPGGSAGSSLSGRACATSSRSSWACSTTSRSTVTGRRDRRHLGPPGRRQGQGLRELRALLRPDPQRPRGPRPLRGRRRQPGGLLRRPADPPRARGRPRRQRDNAPHPLRRQFPDFVDPNVKSTYKNEFLARLRDRGPARSERGRPLRLPQPPAGAGRRGRGREQQCGHPLPVRDRPRRVGQPHLPAHQPARGQPGGGGSRSLLRGPLAHVPGGGGHGDSGLPGQLEPHGLVPLEPLEGTFEGSTGTTTGSPTLAITSLFDFPTNDRSYVAIWAVPIRLPR